MRPPSTTAAPTGGTIASSDTLVTNGPFGDLRGGTFATTIGAGAIKGASDEDVVSCSSDLVRFVIPQGAVAAGSGLVIEIGGDGARISSPDPVGPRSTTRTTKRSIRTRSLAQCRDPPVWSNAGTGAGASSASRTRDSASCSSSRRGCAPSWSDRHHPKFCPAKLPTSSAWDLAGGYSAGDVAGERGDRARRPCEAFERRRPRGRARAVRPDDIESTPDADVGRTAVSTACDGSARRLADGRAVGASCDIERRGAHRRGRPGRRASAHSRPRTRERRRASSDARRRVWTIRDGQGRRRRRVSATEAEALEAVGLSE